MPTPVRYLLGGVLVNQLGAFVQTFMVLYLTVKGFSPGWAGVTLAVYSGGAVPGMLLGGELTSRFGSRTTIVAAMATSAAVLAVMPLLTEPGLLAALLVAVAVAGLATQCCRPAAAVLLSDLMPEEFRVMGFSMMRIALNIGAALAPLIAAGLVLVDWDLLFWFDSVTAAAYAGLALVLLPATGRAVDLRGDSAQPVRTGYLAVLADGRFLLFLASVLLGSVVYVQYTVALPLKLAADGHPASLYSTVLVTASLVLIVCELKITSYVTRWPGYVAATAGTVLMALGVAGYGISATSFVLLIVSTVVFVFGIMVNGPTMFAYPATFPAAVRARYVGAQQAIFGLGMASGPVFGVLAWQGLGNAVWWLCGGIGAVAALCTLAGMKTPLRAPVAVAEPVPAA